MPRPFPSSSNSEPASDGTARELAALRSELMALLDQVEDRYGKEGTAVEGVARRVRDLRGELDTPAATAREPLQDRPATVHSAIEEIRTRQQTLRPRVPGDPPSTPKPPQDLGLSVSTISNRLGAIEASLRDAPQLKATQEIAQQMQQLVHMVELLAGAVGETGQVKRLEGQIAGLGKLLAQTPKVDGSAVMSRLDELSATVERLADLQIRQVERTLQGDESAKAQSHAMQGVESVVRSIYDRVDTVERTLALRPHELEALTTELRAFIEAMQAPPSAAVPELLTTRLDALQSRMNEIDDHGNGSILALKADIGALRQGLVGGLEPRFAALEERIGALRELLSQPPGPDFSALEGKIDTLSGQVAEGNRGSALANVEAQLRHLVARMDQTGEQLSGLARLHRDAPPSGGDLDTEALGAEIARQTAEAVGRLKAEPAVLSEAGLNAVEARLARLVETAAAPAPLDLGELRDAIRHVDDRMGRIETALTALRNTAQVVSGQPPVKAASAVVAPASTLAEALRTESVAQSASTEDAWPTDGEAAGRARTVDGIEAVRAALAAAQLKHEGPDGDGKTAARGGRTDVRTEPGEAAAAAADQTSAGSRNTFIEAARRATQRQAASPADIGQDSLVGRALARFQSGTAGQRPGAAAPDSKGKRVKVSKTASLVEKAGGAPRPLDDEEPSESLLVRHRRIILLVAAAIAVCLMAVNLIGMRLGQGRQPVAPPAAQSGAPAASQPSAGAETSVRVISSAMRSPTPTAQTAVPLTVDNSATGSASPLLAYDAVAPAPMPPALATANFSPETTAAPSSAPALPVDLGPQALRDAAAAGDARAQFEVAAIYGEGRLVPQDLAAAATWYQLSADQDFAPSQYRLGNLYETGKGVEPDAAQAKAWYERAAAQGNRMAMHNLAALHAGGVLGPQDFDAAATLFKQAAALGLRDSQFNLGMLFARGLGVEQSMAESYRWFSLAALQGDADAETARADVLRSLDTDAVARIDDEVAAWTPQRMELAANFAPLGTWSADFAPGEPITDQQVVRAVQQALVRLGYDVGTPDGLAGGKTADAIRAFETATGMSASGAVNPRLLAVLGSQPI